MCIGWSSQVSIGNLSLHLEGGTIPPYCALRFLLFISIGVNRLCISIVFVLNKTLTKKDEIFLFTCMQCDYNQHQRNREHANVILNY